MASHLDQILKLWTSGDSGAFNGPNLIALTNSLSGFDLDATRLHCFRKFELKLDLEQAVVKVGAFHLDIVGEIEAPLK